MLNTLIGQDSKFSALKHRLQGWQESLNLSKTTQKYVSFQTIPWQRYLFAVVLWDLNHSKFSLVQKPWQAQLEALLVDTILNLPNSNLKNSASTFQVWTKHCTCAGEWHCPFKCVRYSELWVLISTLSIVRLWVVKFSQMFCCIVRHVVLDLGKIYSFHQCLTTTTATTTK